MFAGTAAIEQDELGKRVSFKILVAFLLQFDPAVAKNVKAKGLGVNLLATSGIRLPVVQPWARLALNYAGMSPRSLANC